MAKERTDYSYVAYRTSPDNRYEPGDIVVRRLIKPKHGKWVENRRYDFASENYDPEASGFWFMTPGTAMWRDSWGCPQFLRKGSSIYKECIEAYNRLIKEENERQEGS